jgi:hypothetical protein
MFLDILIIQNKRMSEARISRANECLQVFRKEAALLRLRNTRNREINSVA